MGPFNVRATRSTQLSFIEHVASICHAGAPGRPSEIAQEWVASTPALPQWWGDHETHLLELALARLNCDTPPSLEVLCELAR